MRKYVLLISLVAGWFAGNCQLDNRVFEDRRDIDPADSNKLFLGLQVLGFGKDNEYDKYRNPVVTGYTLFGYQFNPYLSYHLNPHLRLDAGVYLQQDFGNSKISTAVPTFSVKYQRKSLAVIFGNLEGSLNHRLIEPLYDFERVLNKRLESGLQVKVMRDDLFFDAWIDWQKMIYYNDPSQEQLTTGLSFNKRILSTSRTQLWIPIQLVVHHRGGQINYAYSGPIETIGNNAVGLDIRHQSSGLVNEYRLSGYYVYYKSITQGGLEPFQDGSGTYINATAATRFGLDVMGSFWYGHEFITVQGGRIYPSVSVNNDHLQHHLMKLFILRLLYNFKVQEGLYITARVEPYYDFYYRSIQTSYGLYLNFRDRFLLWKRHAK